MKALIKLCEQEKKQGVTAQELLCDYEQWCITGMHRDVELLTKYIDAHGGIYFLPLVFVVKIVWILPLLPQELQKGSSSKKGDQGGSEKTSMENIQSSVPLFLQYPVPYTPDAPTPLLVSQSPSKLHFGNPYSISDSKGWFPFSENNIFCSVFQKVFQNLSIQ